MWIKLTQYEFCVPEQTNKSIWVNLGNAFALEEEGESTRIQFTHYGVNVQETPEQILEKGIV